MMDWILHLPDISGGIQFGYEFISFVFLIAALALSFLTCIRGYKIIRTAFFIAACLIFGLIGIRLAERVVQNLIFRLVFFISFIFIGLALLQLVLMLLGIPAKALRLDRLFMKIQFFVTALLGAGAFSVLVYFRVFHNLPAAGGIFIVLAVLGCVVQYRRKKTERPAHTYDDLYQMPQCPEQEEVPQE